jgi:hypothetical protein
MIQLLGLLLLLWTTVICIVDRNDNGNNRFLITVATATRLPWIATRGGVFFGNDKNKEEEKSTATISYTDDAKCEQHGQQPQQHESRCNGECGIHERKR